MTKIHPL